ncbi:MAG: hypothetical protein J6Y91_00710 [Alphaproteobacteria bacterium]|nr:hypothetical protein [Alphaproteobacteria bacterium]
MDEEYIKSLSYEEKIVFLKIFCKLVRADGAIASEEVDLLKRVAAKYGVPMEEMVQIIKMPNIDHVLEASKIKDRHHALLLVKELCLFSNIDEDLADNELDVVIDAARAMGIEDNKIILINRLVLDSLILAKTGRVIMEEDNG